MNTGFKELLLTFNAHDVEYLIVGAQERNDLLDWSTPLDIYTFIISRHHLITNKRITASLQDLADVEQLEATKDLLKENASS